MKREEVKNKIPGITDEQLDWLMGENGRDVTAEKTKAASLQTQVNELTTQLKAFEGVDVNDLKGQITKLQGRKVYGIKVSKPQTLYIKRVEAAVG